VEFRRRVIAAAVALLLGIAFCFVMYWWQLRYRYGFHDAADNLWLAIPFAGLAVMVWGGLRLVPAILGWLFLALITGAAYVGNATSSSSTAPVIFIAPFVYGTVVLSILFAIDSIFRARKRSRQQ
jgi:hypothetical protein